MKVTVPCPVTGRPLTVDIKNVKSEAEARARAIHRLKKAAETFSEDEKKAIVARYQAHQQKRDQAQLVLAMKVLDGLKNKSELDVMNLEALTRLMA
jgi:hypothetical protein